MKRILSAFMVTLIVVSTLALAVDVRPVKASGTIYIRADGSIDPPTANITTTDTVTYTFTDNNYDSIVVERNNIAIDGNNYTLEGTGSEDGMRVSERTNVTVQNTRITNFHVGIRLDYSSCNKNVISSNIISNNNYGLFLVSSANNTILANEVLMYMVWWHDTAYYTRSTWLKGWYVNTAYGLDLWSTMYFEAP